MRAYLGKISSELEKEEKLEMQLGCWE
jgi:hypothetical protein